MQEDKPISNGTEGWAWTQLKRNQKIAFIAFVVGAVFLLFMTGASVMDGINAPFKGKVADLIKNKELLQDPTKVQEEYEKRTDTDGDGISDWDEQNIYKTSPYLWSTAGDEVPDNVKIALGENPWCKHGEKCTPNPMRFDFATTSLPYTDLINQQNTAQDLNAYLTNNEQLKAGAEQAGANMDLRSQVPKDPAVLRKALIDSGKVTQEDLDKLTDEQLMQLVDQAINETEEQQKNTAEALKNKGGTGTAASTTAGQAGANQF